MNGLADNGLVDNGLVDNNGFHLYLYLYDLPYIFTYTLVSRFISSNISSGNELNGLSKIVLKRRKVTIVDRQLSLSCLYIFMFSDVFNAVISNDSNSLVQQNRFQ